MDNNKKPKSGEFCWSELLTSDTQKAKEFYTTVLGWETTELNVEGKIYTKFMAENREFGGMMQLPSAQKGQASHWTSYIAVKDLTETLEKAQKLGAHILKPVTVVPEKGRFAIITDPTGAVIAFWECFL